MAALGWVDGQVDALERELARIAMPPPAALLPAPPSPRAPPRGHVPAASAASSASRSRFRLMDRSSHDTRTACWPNCKFSVSSTKEVVNTRYSVAKAEARQAKASLDRSLAENPSHLSAALTIMSSVTPSSSVMGRGAG